MMDWAEEVAVMHDMGDVAGALDALERAIDAGGDVRDRALERGARLLGANARGWTFERRCRLAVLLGEAGRDGLLAALDAYAECPRADVADEVIRVIAVIKTSNFASYKR